MMLEGYSNLLQMDTRDGKQSNTRGTSLSYLPVRMQRLRLGNYNLGHGLVDLQQRCAQRHVNHGASNEAFS